MSINDSHFRELEVLGSLISVNPVSQYALLLTVDSLFARLKVSTSFWYANND